MKPTKVFSAESRVKVISRVEEEKTIITKNGVSYENIKAKWSFDKLKVDDIALECKSGAF